jgi:biopolymer transport protein ExbD
MASASETDTDPDLTAMLDMVMQMLMFFIICAGFIKSEKNEDVMLPRSDEAHVIDAVDKETYMLNLIPYRAEDMAKRIHDPKKLEVIKNSFQEGEPCIIIPYEEYPLRVVELDPWLQKKAEFAQKMSPDGKNHKVIIMRADRNLDYALVFRLLKLCKANGFRDLKLRALTPDPNR